jgi:hypothetical protein
MNKIPTALLVAGVTLVLSRPLLAAGPESTAGQGPQAVAAIPVAEKGDDDAEVGRGRLWRDRQDQDRDWRWREHRRRPPHPMPAPEMMRRPGMSRGGPGGTPEAVYRFARGDAHIEVRCPAGILERCVKAANELISQFMSESSPSRHDEGTGSTASPEQDSKPAHMPEGGSCPQVAIIPAAHGRRAR